MQYADYTLWQRGLLGEETDPESLISRQIDHWRTTSPACPSNSSCPLTGPAPRSPGYRGRGRGLRVGTPRLHEGIARLAREHQVTVFMVLHAALAALPQPGWARARTSRSAPVAGRTDDALEDLVGFFVNTLVLRTDTSGDPSFTELLARVRETDLAAYAHQDVPFRTARRDRQPHPVTRPPSPLPGDAGAGEQGRGRLRDGGTRRLRRRVRRLRGQVRPDLPHG